MIVPKILIDNQYVPDIPEGLEYESCTLNADGETYTVKQSQEQQERFRISPAQCRVQLHRMGLLTTVEEAVKQDPEMAIYWEYATYIDYNDTYANLLASSFGIDKDEFFEQARKI